jgi:anaerobic magnesium-protoporphyrin IX monomethyl ester cyclase
MRVLLFNPPGPEGRGYIREGRCEQRLSSFAYRMVPISLPSIAGLLRAEGHDVKILDGVAPRSAPVLQEVRSLDPELIVVSVSTPTYESDLGHIDELSRATRAHLTAIGVHVSATAEETLRGSALTSVVRGEPEWTVAELATTLATGGDLGNVRGLSFKRGGLPVRNEDRGFERDLDALPPPARDLLREEDYFLPFLNRPYTLVVPSRGCPHHCTYCTAPIYYGARLRRRTPARIVDEIASVAARGVVQDFVMWSDTFTLDRAFVLDVCRELVDRRLGVRWMCNSRVDSIDAGLARAMRSAGCTGISFGVESGVQETLDNVRKGTTVEQGREALRVTREAGIETLTHFILGLPGETRDTIRRTVAYAKELDPDWAQFYCATPLPGTAFHEQSRRSGSLPMAAPWSDYELNRPVVSTPALSASELQRARRWAYLSFYGRPRAVARAVRKVKPGQLGRFASQAVTFASGWVLDA